MGLLTTLFLKSKALLAKPNEKVPRFYKFVEPTRCPGHRRCGFKGHSDADLARNSQQNSQQRWDVERLTWLSLQDSSEASRANLPAGVAAQDFCQEVPKFGSRLPRSP